MQAETFYRRGHALQQSGDQAGALACFDAAIAARPAYVEALCSRGILLFQLGRFAEALADDDEAVRLRPELGALHFNRAEALEKLARDGEALAAYRRAASLMPDDASVHYALGYRLARQGQYADARDALLHAIRLKPDLVAALIDLAALLLDTGRPEQALAMLDRAHAIAPDTPYLTSRILMVRMQLCDWRDFESSCGALLAAILDAGAKSLPLPLLAMPSRLDHQLKVARAFVSDYRLPAAAPFRHARAAERHGKIRVAYLSASLRNHAVTFLIGDIFALQDRARFEIIALSCWPDDGSAARAQVAKTFDRFIDVSNHDDVSIARLIHELEIDIVVELDGHSQGSRLGVLAMRPAPLQVSFLGYPGTLGADYVDYILADAVVAPPEHERFYTEKIVHLPGCYQPNSRRTRAESIFSRADCGLPQDAMVFCCFNNPNKITPDIYSVWMRLLHSVPGSVLWLLDLNDTARANLLREAQARDVAASRLVFAPPMPHAQHLARVGLADLFLDTRYYNAHTTGSDALWAGVPVVTLRGETFASRVCASLLTALGLEECIAATLADYEAKALALARDQGALSTLKGKLLRARDHAALFDTARFAGHLDDALETMWRRHREGRPPEKFAVLESPQ